MLQIRNTAICRLCLAIGQHQHTFGMAEMEILMENLNLFLVADPRLPKLLCSDCIASLGQVQSFRRKVMATEAELHRVMAHQTKQTKTSGNATVQPSPNDPLEKIIVKTEYDPDSTLNDATIDDVKTEPHQNESNVDVDISKVKIEIEIEPTEDASQDHETPESHQNESSVDIYINKVKIEIEPTEDASQGRPLANVMTVAHKTPDKKLIQPVTSSEKDIIKVKKKRVTEKSNDPYHVSDYISIDGKWHVGSNVTKTRANLLLILKHSTILPFRCSKNNFFKCFYCDINASQFKSIKTHTQTEHGEGQSDYTIFKLMQSRQQKNIHADISNAKCKICDYKFENIDDLVQHLTGVHGKVYYDVKNADKGPSHGVLAFRLDTDDFICHLCKKDFRLFNQLTSHMSEHYDSYVCNTCSKKFLTTDRLKRHLMLHNEVLTKCPDCGKSFKSQNLMKLHRSYMHVKSNRYIFRCTECPKTFRISQTIKRYNHMEKAHGIKKPVHKCEDCGKIYTTEALLTKHKMAIHVRANVMKCDKCDYSTTDKGSMSRHIDHHSGVKKFQCDYCQKKFSTRYSIVLHIQRHTGNMRFHCHLCAKAFIQKHCLTGHMKTKHPNSGVD